MARDIDFDNLSNDDVQYLRQRHALVQEAELLGHKDIRKTVDEWDFDADEEEDAQQDVPVPPQVNEEEEEETPPYSEWSKDELVAELKKRELSASGNKDELVARLESDDEEEEEEEV